MEVARRSEGCTAFVEFMNGCDAHGWHFVFFCSYLYVSWLDVVCSSGFDCQNLSWSRDVWYHHRATVFVIANVFCVYVSAVAFVVLAEHVLLDLPGDRRKKYEQLITELVHQRVRSKTFFFFVCMCDSTSVVWIIKSSEWRVCSAVVPTFVIAICKTHSENAIFRPTPRRQHINTAFVTKFTDASWVNCALWDWLFVRSDSMSCVWLLVTWLHAFYDSRFMSSQSLSSYHSLQ